MKKETWDLIEADIGSDTSEAGPIAYEIIDELCKKNGYAFPKQYREFVHRYGAATLGCFDIYGIRQCDLVEDHEGSVFEITQSFRDDEWPGVENWLIISMDFSGNPVGIDENGEIWISDHDNECIDKLENTFEDYIIEWCYDEDEDED